MPSLLNGLSALGAGEAQFAGSAGLEAQKAALAQQSLQLADQLQGARESAGRVQAGDIAATSAGVQNQFMAGQNDLTRANQVATTKISAGATLGAAAMESSATVRSAQIAASADPAEVRLLKYLGGQNGIGPGAPAPAPSGGTGGGGGSSAPAPSAGGTGGGSYNGSTPTPSSSSDAAASPSAPPSGVINGSGSAPASSSAVTGSAAPAAGASSLFPQVVRKVLGLPLNGSDAQIASAIADGVDKDPQFANATPDQKAMETASRIAVAQGKMMDPNMRPTLVDAIGHYKMAPLEERAMGLPGADKLMGAVFQKYPDYQPAFYPTVQKTFADFTSGAAADKLKTINATAQHLDVFDQTLQALNNGDMHQYNALKQTFAANFGGSPIPTTIDGMKGLITGEVQSAVTGGLGTEGDRLQIQDSLNKANSIPQLLDMTQHFRALVGGQASALQTQYEDGTHITDPKDPFSFQHKLQPQTIKAMSAPMIDYSKAAPPPAVPPAPPINSDTPYSGPIDDATINALAGPAGSAGRPAANRPPLSSILTLPGRSQ